MHVWLSRILLDDEYNTALISLDAEYQNIDFLEFKVKQIVNKVHELALIQYVRKSAGKRNCFGLSLNAATC